MSEFVRRALKWEVPVDDASHQVPGRFLAAGIQRDSATVMVWTEVVGDPDAARLTSYRVFGTGQPIPVTCSHVATVHAPPFVWHLYQTGRAS